MSPTRNTNVWTELQDPAALVRAPSTKIYKLHEAWAVAHGYRKKVQAPSTKLQAASSKRQAKKYYRKLLGPRSTNQQA
jgi:hypothetical protein